MRVLQVGQTHPPEFSGGSTVYAVMLSEALARRGVDVEFLCNTLDGSLAPYEVRTAADGPYRVARMGLPRRRWYGKTHTARVAEACRRLLREKGFDLVHIHSTIGLGEGMLSACAAEGVPGVVTLHEGMWLCPELYFRHTGTGAVCGSASLGKCLVCVCGELRNAPLATLPRTVARAANYTHWVVRRRKAYLALADHIVGCCDFIKDKYAEFGVARPMSVIRNRIRESEIRFKPLLRRKAGRPVVFGTLGAFRPKKGGELLLEALARLGDGRGRFELHIWGSIHPEFARRAGTLLDRPYITAHGAYERKDLNRILSRIEVLVYPSCSGDTYPLVLLEALASRTPVIAAKTHGMAEIVREGENGRFFEPLNAESLCSAMRFFIDTPGAIPEMQKKIAPPPPYEGLVDENIGLYRSIVGRHERTERRGVCA